MARDESKDVFVNVKQDGALNTYRLGTRFDGTPGALFVATFAEPMNGHVRYVPASQYEELERAARELCRCLRGTSCADTAHVWKDLEFLL